MITKLEIVKSILTKSGATLDAALGQTGYGWAPSNIALLKYWGKRDAELNLPLNDSVSVSLGNLGAYTTLSIAKEDEYYLNGKKLDLNNAFSRRLAAFLALFTNKHFKVVSQMNVPVAAGVASSACGFAALVRALDDLFNLHLALNDLMILARLGSGSACRSLLDGFSWWQRGERSDGMDSYAVPISSAAWDDLRIGLFLISDAPKPLSSREAMARTVATSTSYAQFALDANNSLSALINAIERRDLDMVGVIAERNASLMHQAMLDCAQPINYSSSQTNKLKDLVIKARQNGLKVYFTQDAGSNLQIIFQASQLDAVLEWFKEFSANLVVVAPLADCNKMVEGLDAITHRAKGFIPKMLAHYRGDLHRAFSVMITRANDSGEIEVLLQHRSLQKYHSQGLWANACCGHPLALSDVKMAAAKRLEEELGLKVTLDLLKLKGEFIYRADLGGGLKEFELDHLLEVRWTKSLGALTCHLNPAEVSKVRWVTLKELRQELEHHPQQFVAWLKPLLKCYES